MKKYFNNTILIKSLVYLLLLFLTFVITGIIAKILNVNFFMSHFLISLAIWVCVRMSNGPYDKIVQWIFKKLNINQKENK